MGLFGLFESVIDVVDAVADIAIAPAEIAVDLVKAPLKEVAGVAADLVQDVKSLSD